MKFKKLYINTGGAGIYYPEVFKYPGGEVGVRLPEGFLKLSPRNLVINSLIKSNDDLMATLLLHDALQRSPAELISLHIPYIPYARQDRVCSSGEPLSMKVVAKLINACKFHKVLVGDPHSDVATALLDNVIVMSQVDKIRATKGMQDLCPHALVAPDAGAQKRILEVCKMYGHSDYIRCSKVRDPRTGEIMSMEVHQAPVPERCLIVDDICDGGATFKALARRLRARGAKEVVLYVTHGIFSKGKETLLEKSESGGYLDRILCAYDWTKYE